MIDLRRGPFVEGTFTAPARGPRTTTRIGTALGIAFTVCFLTGLVSHFIQHPAWFTTWPTRPVNLYRVTQGLHVTTGFAAIPLLAAKLWSVYPKFFRWPPLKNIADAAARLSILVLAGTAIFELISGLVDMARWYTAMPFFFTVAHYWTAWIVIGSIIVHVAAKITIIRTSRDEIATEPRDGSLSRRNFFIAAGAGSGLVVFAIVGQTFRPLRAVSALAQRDPGVGSQNVPVNKSAQVAGVKSTARDPNYRLMVQAEKSISLSLSDLQAMKQYTVQLPITCVEGWSASATWTGPRLADVLKLAGWDAPHGEVSVESLQKGGLYRASTLPVSFAMDDLTLLALKLNGETLDLDHGYPARLIAPNRPGVLQTKWVNLLKTGAGK